ncbi:hypothetical protein [Okeania sp. KiyG1]|uniref:2OG-Fe(II)-dependent halogenase WelO5 family protein n=1 Tax=Okeania sp. KiyG1 TaxID=2720165 RepID=UPI0019214590|nr:hypothetical protein [Okeania sp. KiyG1]GGA18591.1 hypothetical protein CYANOKiyG1_33110 [Okeania sp. KiyG1]
MTTQVTKNKWITVAADSINQYPDGINQIYQEELEGIVIKQVFSLEEMLNVQQQLEMQKLATHEVRYGQTLGQVIIEIGKDRSEYLQNAQRFREGLTTIFKIDFETKLENIFSQMSGGRNIELPKENGQAYSPATIRFAQPKKGGLPAHTGNEFLHDSAYDYLKSIGKVVNGLSYFIVISKPEEGGELVLFYLPPEHMSKQETDPEKIRLAKQHLDSCPQRKIVPETGDMIIFKGGNIMHKVAEISGNKTRITIGGFLALSQDDQKIYYWS